MRRGRGALAVILVGLMLCASGASPAPQADHFILGQNQYKYDQSGSGAVLCAWGIYLETQAATKACNLARAPGDDAIDKAILDIDDFIIVNSSLHPTRPALEEFKRHHAESFIGGLRSRGDLQKFCTGSDLNAFRSGSPDQIASTVRGLLAKPREPVLNPCL